MIKKLLLIFLIILTGIITTSCDTNERSIILFNKYPICTGNLLDNSTVFKTGERIYFIYMTKDVPDADDIRVKVFKRDEKADMFIYGGLVYSNDFRLKKGEGSFFTDYIVLHKAGNYVMHVYRKDNLWKPDAISDFRVDEQ